MKKKTYKRELSNSDSNTIFISKSKPKSVAPGTGLKTHHSHFHFEITHIFSDEKNSCTESFLVIDDDEYPFDSNSILLIEPNINHYTRRKHENTTRILINLKHEYIDNIAKFINVDISNLFSKHVYNFSNSEILKVRAILQDICDKFNSSVTPEDDVELKISITQLLYLISHANSTTIIQKSKQDSISQAIEYVKNYYYENITLELLSEQFFIDKYELCRKFKRKIGISFNEFLTCTRLNHAKQLLKGTSFSIKEISKKVGFNHASYFTTVFKSKNGISPEEYRERL